MIARNGMKTRVCIAVDMVICIGDPHGTGSLAEGKKFAIANTDYRVLIEVFAEHLGCSLVCEDAVLTESQRLSAAVVKL